MESYAIGDFLQLVFANPKLNIGFHLHFANQFIHLLRFRQLNSRCLSYLRFEGVAISIGKGYNTIQQEQPCG
jgi:hypothetical protein